MHPTFEEIKEAVRQGPHAVHQKTIKRIHGTLFNGSFNGRYWQFECVDKSSTNIDFDGSKSDHIELDQSKSQIAKIILSFDDTSLRGMQFVNRDDQIISTIGRILEKYPGLVRETQDPTIPKLVGETEDATIELSANERLIGVTGKLRS